MSSSGARTSHDTFEDRIARLDESLFDAIPSETTSWDRRSLLACQQAVRRTQGTYVYLEIGSHLGGSLQPHILDPACAVAYSIDPRPGVQADARGSRFAYPGNSTERMRARLSQIGDVERLRCHDSSTASVDAAAIDPRPHLCFVDGEHTDAAVLADFAFCRKVLQPHGLIVFHDAPVVYNALWQIVGELERAGVPFRACVLPDTILAIELGGTGWLDGDDLAPVRRESYRGYLFSLVQTDPYRRFATRLPFRAWRRLRAMLRL